jgi:flavin reductase (DIM6/NTAB) family NADH-FMN oxidoreductase RutF
VVLDERAKREALRTLPHPVFIVGCAFEGKFHLFVGTWLTQVSFKPPLVVFACRKESGSHEMIRKSGVFSVNLLDKAQQGVASAFLKGADIKGTKANGFEFKAPDGAPPALDVAMAVLECRVVQEAEGGDHRVLRTPASTTAAEMRSHSNGSETSRPFQPTHYIRTSSDSAEEVRGVSLW